MMYIHNAKRKSARLLAYVSGLVNQRLLLQCEYLAAENLDLTLSPSVALGRITPTRGLEIATGRPRFGTTGVRGEPGSRG
jgi:hypothetical protein